MRTEFEYFLEQSDMDYQTAEKNYDLKLYYVTAFFCQQALEKALKTLAGIKQKEILHIHSLVKLGELANAPANIMTTLRKISPAYTTARYGILGQDPAYKLYDETDAKDYLLKTKEALTWIHLQLQN